MGIKLDEENGYLYVSTMHDIQEGKINRIDPYKEMEFDHKKAKQEFDIAVDPIYKKYIYDHVV